MSDRKRLLIFAAFLVVFILFLTALNYSDDEPNPWTVEVAVSVLLSLPYLLGALVVWWVVRAIRKLASARRRG